MTKIRCMISGAGGFVASHIFEHVLVNTDWDVVATDSFRHKGVTDRIAQVLDGHPDWRARTEVLVHDLTAPFSPQMIARLGRGGGLDIVIAAASESHVDRSIADPVPFIRNNTDIILNTLELARQLQPRAVAVVSTDEVYGPGLDFPEWSAILPSSPYAASKAAQEAIAFSYWRTYGVPVIIVNCMNLVGERQDVEKYVPSVIRAVQNRDVVPIHGREDNIGTRHYLHPRNLADGILFLLNGPAPAAYPAHATPGQPAADRPDRYNIAGPDRIDNLDLAQRIAAIMERPLKYQLIDFHSARPGHDPHYGLSGLKMNVFGWKPPVPFAESLERTVLWTLQHPEWLL